MTGGDTESTERSSHQTSHGNESPNVVAGGNVTITYTKTGVTQGQFDRLTGELEVSRATALRLLKNLEEKDVALEERESRFEALLKKTRDLEQRLAARDDEVAKKARELIDSGKLDEAEAVLKESLTARLERLNEERELAAAEAYELGGLRELKLDYAGAEEYYRQAVELVPDNTTYLNDLGLIADRLGQHQKAIDYFAQALDIDREVYGERHPQVAIYLNNLGLAWNSLGEYDKGALSSYQIF